MKNVLICFKLLFLFQNTSWWTKHRTFIWILEVITDTEVVIQRHSLPPLYYIFLFWHPHNKEPFEIIWTSVSNGRLSKLGQQFKFVSVFSFLPCCRLLCNNSQMESLPMTETVLSEELVSFLTPCCFNWIVNAKKNLPILSLFLWSRGQKEFLSTCFRRLREWLASTVD